MFKNKTHYYIYTFCRYFLATMILSYAFAKIFGTQFTSQPSVYDKPIGQLTGFELTWFYYGYSYWYGLFIAGSQIAASLLLFFKKTTRIGAILFLTIITNIVAVDFAYNIDAAKFMSILMTMMASFIILSDYKRFFKFFLEEEPFFTEKEQPEWVSKKHKLKFIYIPLVFIGFFILLSTLKNKFMSKDELSGTWACEQPNVGFDRLNFEFNHSFSIYKNCVPKRDKQGEYKIENDELTLSTFSKIYSEELDKSKSNATNFNSNKMNVLIKGKFSIDKNILTVRKDSTMYKFRRIR